MIINVSDNGKSLKQSDNIHLPRFTIITGENGTGKSQLLTSIYNTSSNRLYRSPNSNYGTTQNNTIYDYIHQENRIFPHNSISAEQRDLIALDNNNNPIDSITITKPGFISNEAEENQVFQGIRSRWQQILKARQTLAISNIQELTGDLNAIANSMSGVLETFLKDTLNAGNSFMPNISTQPITELDLYELQRISNVLQIPISKVDEKDYLATLQIPKTTFSPNLHLIFHQFHLKHKYHSMLVEGIRTPLDMFNGILKLCKSKFKIKYTATENDMVIQKVRFTKTNANIDFGLESLSSGEQTIMSLATAYYNAMEGGSFPALLLFDEPDAMLHPSMAKVFLDVMNEIIQRDPNVNIIMTTHSASTIAMADPESLFEMKEGIGFPVKIDQSEAIKNLTDGLILVTDKLKYVFVEDEIDRIFYTEVFQQLIRLGLLPVGKTLVFKKASVSGRTGGCNAVQDWVKHFNDFNMVIPTAGLIDRDSENMKSKNLFVLDRYSYENYLIDPVLIYIALMANDNHFQITSSRIEFGEEYKVKDLKSIDLQEIANHIIKAIGTDVIASYGNLSEKDEAMVTIEYHNGKNIQVPGWLFNRPGKDIAGKILNKCFPKKGLNIASLNLAMKKARLYPKDLIKKLTDIQNA